MIFNIQRCSIHDGNGIRTLVFLKGCPLTCKWCANPESQAYGPEVMELPSRCIGCGACEKICPVGAVTVIDGEYRIDRDSCQGCFKCTDRCYAEAKKVVGQDYSVNEIFVEIEKDRSFYSLYGGGVTFSGGEPLTHPWFLTGIAEKCRQNGINVAVETCGYGDFEKFKTVLPYLNQMFFDIKHIDPAIHKELTGVDNELILANARKIAATGLPMTIRTPIIPGLNNAPENIRSIAELVATLPSAKEYELLPYHNFGESKYKSLGQPYALAATQTPSNEEMDALVKVANELLEPVGKECFYIVDNERRQ